MKRRNSLLLSLWMAGTVSLMAQTPVSLILSTSTGAEQLWELATIQKISFSGDDMLVNLKSGTISTFGLSEINKFYFSTRTGILENKLTDDSMPLIVSKSTSELTVNTQGAKRVELLHIDGSHLQQVTVDGDQCTVSINHLPQGIYLVRVADKVAKFVKQ